ncbi:DUF429 domain-containing protein [Chloroflexota bacterium]
MINPEHYSPDRLVLFVLRSEGKMLFTEATFIGIDPTAGERPFSYAALDHELKLLAMGSGDIDSLLAFCAGQESALVAICSPQRPNQGLMKREDYRQSLSPPPNPGRWMDFRVVDYLLRQHNIRIPQTREQESNCPKWMQMGFALYRRLGQFGYKSFPLQDARRQYLEVYPYASYAAMLDVLPLQKHSMEGRLQRQLVLYELGLNLPDPMRFFEEITRHRLMHGILPLDRLHTAGELDALVGAYTAWKTAKQPEAIMLLGDAVEGQIVMPVPALKERY